MAEEYVDAVAWARTVGPDDPHDLRDVEDVLLRNHPDNQQRLEQKPVNRGLAWFWLLYALAPFIPLWGPITLGGGWFRGRTIEASTINDGLWQVGIAFWFAVAFFAHQLFTWWRHRYRSGAAVGFAVFDIALGVVTLVMISGDLDAFYGNTTLHLFPIWATIVLAAVAAVLYGVSPTDPGRMAPKYLDEESRDLLVRERSSALAVLAERGMLPGHDLGALAQRPLGELHRPQGRDA